MSIPLNKEPPPVRKIPFSIISDANSGGVSSRVVLIASTISFIGSLRASLTSVDPIVIVLGRPDIMSLPLTVISISLSPGKADPIANLIFSAVLAPIMIL